MDNDRLLTNNYIKLENTYINLPDIFYSKQYPNEVPLPKLIIFNDSLAQSLGMDKDFLKSSNGIEILSGNKILEGTTPIASGICWSSVWIFYNAWRWKSNSFRRICI